MYATHIHSDSMSSQGAAKGRQDFIELRARLDSLLTDTGELLSGTIAPTMTASVRNLCR